MPPNDWPKYEIFATDRDLASRLRRRPSRPRSRARGSSGRSPSAASRRGCPTSVCGGAALTPSVVSIALSPSWSIPRPPAGSTTGPPAERLTISVPSGPPPWPTTLIAIVAIPRRAIEPATRNGLPFLLSREAVAVDGDRPPARGSRSGREEEIEVQTVRPLHGGHAGAGADGGNDLRRRLVVRRVESAERDRADAGQEWSPGRPRRTKVGAVPVCRENEIEVTLPSGNTVRSPPAPSTKSRGPGWTP